MLAFLISDGSRPGSQALAQDLSEIFELQLVSPVYVTEREAQEKELLDASAFLAFHLRSPTLGEIGCALAHRQAQQRLAASEGNLAAIFEDDAQIEDSTHLSNRLTVYEHLCSRDLPTVINLNQNALPLRLGLSGSHPTGLSQALTPPYPATAYVINRTAAQLFVTSQTPIRSQADWPRTRMAVSYLVDRQSSVYEDLRLASSIDTHGTREVINATRKLRMWTGLWFWQFREYFPSLRHYWKWHPYARLVHHADSVVRRFWKVPR